MELLTDLSKVIDCIPHDLIIGKIVALSFNTESLKLVQNDLSNRKQRVKVNRTYSVWKHIFYGVLPCSILGPVFFSINLYELFDFLENTDNASYSIQQKITMRQ